MKQKFLLSFLIIINLLGTTFASDVQSVVTDENEVRIMADRANAGAWVIAMMKSYEVFASTCSNKFPDMQKDFEMAIAGLNDRNRAIVMKADIARERILQQVEKSGGKEKAKKYAEVLDSLVEQEVLRTKERTSVEDSNFCKRHLRSMSSGEWDIQRRNMGAYRKLMQ